MNDYANSNPTVFLDLIEVFISEKNWEVNVLKWASEWMVQKIKSKGVMLSKACLIQRKNLSTIYCMIFSHGDNF